MGDTQINWINPLDSSLTAFFSLKYFFETFNRIVFFSLFIFKVSFWQSHNYMNSGLGLWLLLFLSKWFDAQLLKTKHSEQFWIRVFQAYWLCLWLKAMQINQNLTTKPFINVPFNFITHLAWYKNKFYH